MHSRARRAVSLALSVTVHLLLLLDLYTWTLIQPGFVSQKPLPVRIIEPPPPPPKAKAAPKPPQQVAAKPPEPAKSIEEPPVPAPPQPPPPEHKIPVPEQQIVSPSDQGKNEAPPDTRFLSDRDNRVDQQTVKKGNPAPGEEAPGEKAPPKPAPPAKPAKPAEARGGGRTDREPPPRIASLPGLDRLMPDALRLAEEGYGKQAEVQPGQQVAQADQNRPVQPRGSDGLMIPSAGPIGSMDFLPDVREGDITLLNTKAEVFAPFVRRVAIRVFQNFWISLKRDLVGSALATTETVEAEAVMDPAGEMIGFNVNQRSARISLASDRRLQQACNDGFFDRNPPPGARAKDGKIHFIFRTAVESQPTPRGTAYWVQLEAGLL
jgi:hypothetical protein